MPTHPAAGLRVQIDAVDLVALGFRPDDAADVRALAARVDAAGWTQVGAVAAMLRASVDHGPQPERSAEPPLPAGPLPAGEAYLLGLVATAGDAAGAYRRLGVPEELITRSLADLGQQVWVHRRFGAGFGLHSQRWLAGTSWRANLFWLGRLQVEFRPAPGGWWWSVHIPETGPLTPASVDAALVAARDLAAAHFPDRRLVGFHCDSWLLDPQLADVVPGTNLAAFQARWTRFGEPRVADAGVLGFVFHRWGEVDLDGLPQRSRLERAVVARLRDGGHWYGWQGTMPIGG